MSDHVWHFEYVSGKRGSVKNTKKNSILTGFLLIIFLLIIIIVRGVLVPRFRIEKIFIDSNLNVSNEEILERAGLSTESVLYFSVDTYVIEKRLAEWPKVKEVEVEKFFPNALKISISSREPLVYLLVENDGIIFPAVCDDEGIVFDAGKNMRYEGMPVISGIGFKNFIVGAKLPDVIIAFMKNLKGVKESNPELFALISELRFIKRGDYSFDYFIYFKGIRLPVLVNNDISESMLKYALLIVDVVSSKVDFKKIEYIDLRGNIVSYKLRSNI
ncbi:FtsQ-type POTRA domain-containing protein [Spirochaetia bacterium 38H-sp]|uniref:FtsQ-type POTRA domain-containing protein n=1 Tax=Rarispira pelagica TaxID=3141764 RepID=A0ABU9UET8_9SPIR